MNKRDPSVLHSNMKCIFVFIGFLEVLFSSDLAIRLCKICCKNIDDHLAKTPVFRFPVSI